MPSSFRVHRWSRTWGSGRRGGGYMVHWMYKYVGRGTVTDAGVRILRYIWTWLMQEAFGQIAIIAGFDLYFVCIRWLSCQCARERERVCTKRLAGVSWKLEERIASDSACKPKTSNAHVRREHVSIQSATYRHTDMPWHIHSLSQWLRENAKQRKQPSIVPNVVAVIFVQEVKHRRLQHIPAQHEHAPGKDPFATLPLVTELYHTNPISSSNLKGGLCHAYPVSRVRTYIPKTVANWPSGRPGVRSLAWATSWLMRLRWFGPYRE